jgi:hypothetical protein
MDNHKNIGIPQHWMIDTGVTTYWPYPEGIWVNKDTEPILRLVAVYHNLMDIPEAKDQLTQCNDQFVNEFASDLLSLFKPVMADVRAGKKTNTPQLSEPDNEKIISIYKQWVDTWALGSNTMLEWVAGIHIFQIVFGMLPLSRADLRRLESRLKQIGSQFSPSWAWKTLLSGEYRRLDQTRRELARCTIQSDGFYRKHERALLTHARYWIMFYILGYSETDLTETFNIPLPSMSRMLKPFNTALLELDQRPKPGRPDGAKTTDRAKEEQERKREEKLEKVAIRVPDVLVPGRCPKCDNRLFDNDCLICGYHNYNF